MSRRTNYTVGLLLILATLAIIFAVGFVALPQLSGESGVVFTNPAQAQNSGEIAVISTDSEESSDTDGSSIILPTKEVIADPTAIIADSGSTVLALDMSESIADEPTVDEIEEAIVEVVADESETEGQDSAESATLSAEVPAAIEGTAGAETWLFSIQNEQEGWLGIFFKAGDAVKIYGRSEDSKWLHVEHGVTVQGWVYADAIDQGEIDIASLPVSNFVGDAEQLAILQQAVVQEVVPTATAQQIAVAAVQSTATPQPTWTPWPVPSATPTGPWVKGQPVSNPWPTSTATPFATWTPQAGNNTSQPIATPWPTPTPWPTATTAASAPAVRPQPTAFPTNAPVPTRTPAPLPSAQAAAAANEPVPTQDADIAETNAIAWWHTDVDSLQGNGGKWRVDIIVRVPTSFKYGFEMERLVGTKLSEQNSDGDDYFTLSVSGIDCANSYTGVLIVRQNGARMNVVNEFNLSEGAIVIRPPC